MMRRAMMLVAALGALITPAGMGRPLIVEPRRAPPLDFVPPPAKARVRRVRDAGRLQLHAWREIPCEAPAGYFWRRRPVGGAYKAPT